MIDQRWEVVVWMAREMEKALAKGQRPDDAMVARLVHGVLDFQQHLVGLQDEVLPRRRPTSS